MTTITVNERTNAGKTLLQMATLLIKDHKGITIDSPSKKTVDTSLTLNQKKFVNRLVKIKKDVENNKYVGQSLNDFLNEL